jgi:microcompartment protein CcmL/EutN
MATPPPIPTLGVLEFSSVAKGYVVCDALLKKADVRLLRATPVGSGKFLVILTGSEADLDEAVTEGRYVGEDHLLGWSYLPMVDPQVIGALRRTRPEVTLDAVGILEASSLVSAIHAADAAVKAAGVTLLELTFDLDLGGKAYFSLTGDLAEVEAALEAAELKLRSDGAFLNREIIARPHEGMDAIVRSAQGYVCF